MTTSLAPLTVPRPDHVDDPDLIRAVAARLLSAVPDLGLSVSDRRAIGFRTQLLLDSAMTGPCSAGEVRRHARRLRALLRATGNPAARALAHTIDEQSVDQDWPSVFCRMVRPTD